MRINDITIPELRLFLLVASTLSFSDAAREAGVPQSGVSAKIKQLEEKLGVSLIDRTTRSVSLTDAGVNFRPQVERILKDLESQISTLRQLRDLDQGHVTIACVPSVAMRLLPNMIARFKSQYPKVSVEVHEVTAPQTRALLHSGSADFAISNEPPPSSEIRAEVLLQDVFAVIIRRDHPFAQQTSVSWSEILAEGLIMMSGQTGIRHEMERLIAPDILRAAARYEATHPSSVLAMVTEGIGVAVMPSLTWPAADDRHLSMRAIEGQKLVRSLFLIQRAKKSLSPAARAFRQFLVNGAAQQMNQGQFHTRP